MTQDLEFFPLSEWGFSSRHPFLIAGPCGVESYEQIITVAKELKGSPVSLLRGGIWKPRTRPDSFEGIGREGLKWLKEAGEILGVPVTVEVANPAHVEDALRSKIDVLWIGARTTVNPFLVQELANALQGTGIPLLIKNPINPDLELWIGAMERFFRAGITRLAAVHRGFSGLDRSKYRNHPNWPIPIELKRRFPKVPLICDPSHISGNRSLIQSISQTAMDLNYDGLMIEVHSNPSAALSDKEQQLRPSEYAEVIESLIIRSPSVNDVIFLNLLEELRDNIDTIDEEILTMLARRMKVAREIGRYKKENNMTILQVERWNEILRTRKEAGKNMELGADFITKLYELIHDESIQHQTQVMNRIEKENLI